MTIEEFTKDEKTFLLGNVANMNIPFGHPEYEKISPVARSIIKKLEVSLGIKAMEQPKPLASAARKKPRTKSKTR